MAGRAALLAAGAALLWAPVPATASHPPAPPRDAYAEAKRPDQVVVTWRAGDDSGEPERYTVLRDGVEVGQSEDGRFVDEWLLERTRYEYSVRAERDGRESPGSAPARITTPASRAFSRASFTRAGSRS